MALKTPIIIDAGSTHRPGVEATTSPRGGGEPAAQRVELLTNINVTLHDRVVRSLMNPRRLHTDKHGLKERLCAAKALVAQGDGLPASRQRP